MHTTVTLIGNAHIDPVWLWQWREGYHEVKASFRSALDRMKENPEFVFTCACACYYEWVEENDPAMLEEIRERVKEGRWAIVGGMYRTFGYFNNEVLTESVEAIFPDINHNHYKLCNKTMKKQNAA